jgi:large subunit ribosomal protein L30
MPEKLKVTLTRSPISCKWDQKRTVRALGSSRVLPDNPAIRGMVRKVHHLVTAEPVAEAPAPKQRRPSVIVIGRAEQQEQATSMAQPEEAETEKEAE